MPIGYWDSSANGGSGCYIEWSTYSCTTLDYNGDGDYGSLTYVGGDPANGYYGSISNSAYSTGGYFLSGLYTSLDSNGSGFWNSQAYYNGNSQSTGWNAYYYYIDNVQTTLDEFGDGIWNGNTYVNGVIQIVATRFAISGDWNNVSNWTDDSLVTATVMPDGTASVSVFADVTSNSGSTPVMPTVTVDGARIEITIEVSGSVIFRNGGVLAATGYITGDAEFRDSSYMESGSTITGDATFRGNSYNASGVMGSVTAAHGGGINGSNVLGFA